MKLIKPIATESFEDAIRGICVVQYLKDGTPHVYCDMKERTRLTEMYGETPELARIIIERMQRKETDKYNNGKLLE